MPALSSGSGISSFSSSSFFSSASDVADTLSNLAPVKPSAYPPSHALSGSEANCWPSSEKAFSTEETNPSPRVFCSKVVRPPTETRQTARTATVAATAPIIASV
eukprot:1328185-Rhodomonas_salina.1